LWVLDETWDLYKVEIAALQSGVSAIMIIESLEPVVVPLPDSNYAVDTTNLAEVSYENLLALLALKVFSVSLTGAPVAADLSTSLSEVLQGEEVIVSSNGLDNEDEESDLLAEIEYRPPSGSWTPLEANYTGVAPSGHWEAKFVPAVNELDGSYDFRVTYTDSAGNVSEPLELLNAVNVIAVAEPPQVVEFSPADGQVDVPASTSVNVTFSAEMDRASVEQAFSLTSAGGEVVKGLFQWSDNTLTFIPSEILGFETTYHVMVAGSARSVLGLGLDTDGDGVAEGSPEDDLSWQFTTGIFSILSVEPVSQTTLPGDFITVDIVVRQAAQLSSFVFAINYDPAILEIIKVERASFAMWRPRPKIITNADVWLPTVIDEEQGLITIAADNTRSGGVSGKGTLTTLTFRTVGVGFSPVKLQDVSFINALDEKILTELRDGNVQVDAFSPWDINNDGVVNIVDFIIIQEERGASTDINGDGVTDILDMVAAAGGAKASPFVPLEDVLGCNFPNPFNPETWIPYQLTRDANVVVSIYSSTGQLVKVLDLGYRPAGIYFNKAAAAHWDGSNEAGEPVASGIYYYAIKAGNFSAVKKMLVSK